MDIQQPGISSAQGTTPYTLGPPSPPYIHVPLRSREAIVITPTTTNIASMDIDQNQLRVITQGNQLESARDSSPQWTYEERRKAQRILDFLFLGPSSAARNQQFLEEQGVTLVMPLRYVPKSTNANSPFLMIGATAATRALGIPVEPIDVSDNSQMISLFPEIIRKINGHILSRHAENRTADPTAGGKLHDAKILVCCETGNGRSALVVAAYIMAMYGLDLIASLSFLSMRRFSVTYSEDDKRDLQTWASLLQARQDVAQAAQSCTLRKRAISDTYDDDEMADANTAFPEQMDDEVRFSSRTFVPFIDRRNSLDYPV